MHRGENYAKIPIEEKQERKGETDMKVLFVNCCIRGEASRTLRLCRVAIEAIHTTFPTAEVEELCLDQEALLPLHSDTLAQRPCAGGGPRRLTIHVRYARQFACRRCDPGGGCIIGSTSSRLLLRCYVEHYLR